MFPVFACLTVYGCIRGQVDMCLGATFNGLHEGPGQFYPQLP